MNVPTLSPGNRGYDVVTMMTTCRKSSGPAARSEAPGRDQGLDQNRLRHLRLPLAPFDEDDWHFADAGAGAAGLEEHFDQKGVPIGDDALERKTRECLTAPASESARAVLGRELRHRLDVAVGEG